jgi:hypothetical protein
MCDARVDLIKSRNLDLQEVKPVHVILKEQVENESNLLKTGGRKR